MIDATDFLNRPYKVPNQEESRDFISFIEDKEAYIAIKYLLGQSLWDEFKAQMETSGGPEERFQLLYDGADYTNNGKTYHYNGWIDLVRPAIYSEWLPESLYINTNVGVVINNAPQMSSVQDDQYVFQVRAWNDFVNKAGGYHRYSYKNSYNCVSTFYGYMKANESDFESWQFRCPQYKNRHDI